MTMYKENKSYVLRKGRVSKRQQFALDNWAGDYLLPADGVWNFSRLFPCQQPVVVEIGFGMGHSLIAMAKQRPDWNFIGIEVHLAGIGSLVADLHEEALDNVRIVTTDAVEIFKNQLPKASIAGVQIFFPDPWHKKKHNKRRLIQPPFVALMTNCLQTGGFIHCATDWQDYAEQMLLVLSSEPGLKNAGMDETFLPRPATRPITKFERRGINLGHQVRDLIFTRV